MAAICSPEASASRIISIICPNNGSILLVSSFAVILWFSFAAEHIASDSANGNQFCDIYKHSFVRLLIRERLEQQGSEVATLSVKHCCMAFAIASKEDDGSLFFFLFVLLCYFQNSLNVRRDFFEKFVLDYGLTPPISVFSVSFLAFKASFLISSIVVRC